MSGAPEFDWDEVDVIQRSVDQVAIYTNPAGDVVIRRERGWYEDDDGITVIARGNAVAACYAILAAAELPMQLVEVTGGGYRDIEAPVADPAPSPASKQPKDTTGAERQRRYRQRKRNGETVTPDRDGVTEVTELNLVAAE